MSKLNNLKIKKKLIIAFVFIVVLSSISGIYSVIYTGTVNEEYSYAMKNYGFAQGDVGKLLACFGSINVSVHDAIGYIDEDGQENAQNIYETQIAKMDDYLEAVEKSIVIESTLTEFNTGKDAWNKYVPLAEELMKEGSSESSEVIQQVQTRVQEELQPLYDTFYTSMANVLFAKVDDGNLLQESLTKGINNTRWFVLALIIVSVIISLVLGTSIAKSIADPVNQCAKRLRDLSHGDLKSPVPEFHSKNEIGVLSQSTEEIVTGLNLIIEDERYLLTSMANGNFDIQSKITERYVGDFYAVLEAVREINNRLSITLSQINESSEQVSNGSDQVSSASQNLSQGAAEQAGSIEGLTTTIEEILVQVKNNADHAEQVNRQVRSVGQEMQESNEKMQDMIQAMEEISNSSSEIGKIIKTIEDIAFQTNILALNAAVEAARAGAAGKGFAVVADEVRNLASKSADASKNTAQLIESSVRSVENGTKIAGETAEALLAAVDGVEEVVKVVEKISEASVEQSTSIEKVTQNAEQISNVVQTNSATAEEAAAASEELFGQAQMLKNLVDQFNLKKEGTPSVELKQKQSKIADLETQEIQGASRAFAYNSKY